MPDPVVVVIEDEPQIRSFSGPPWKARATGSSRRRPEPTA